MSSGGASKLPELEALDVAPDEPVPEGHKTDGSIMAELVVGLGYDRAFGQAESRTPPPVVISCGSRDSMAHLADDAMDVVVMDSPCYDASRSFHGPVHRQGERGGGGAGPPAEDGGRLCRMPPGAQGGWDALAKGPTRLPPTEWLALTRMVGLD